MLRRLIPLVGQRRVFRNFLYAHILKPCTRHSSPYWSRKTAISKGERSLALKCRCRGENSAKYCGTSARVQRVDDNRWFNVANVASAIRREHGLLRGSWCVLCIINSSGVFQPLARIFISCFEIHWGAIRWSEENYNRGGIPNQ